MSKIVFVYPDFESLGVEYLMAVCLADGHGVDFVSYQADDPFLGKKTRNIPYQQIADKIVEKQPDIVAFSCVTDNYQYQLRTAEALKDMMPSITTIFGGIHPTAVPEKVLQKAQVDCVAIGEAEKSLSDFLKAGQRDDNFVLPEKPIDGIVFKKEGRCVGEFAEGPLVDLDELPFPHKAPFLSSLRYLSHDYWIMTSRGCPYKCSYCFNSFLLELRGTSFVRHRTVENVISELVWAKALYSIEYVIFVDDSFATNMEWVIDFCNRYRNEIGLPFSCLANPNYLNRKIIENLSSAGCINVQIGIQSLSEDLCDKILNRKSDNAKIAQAIKDLRDVGIMVQVDHLLGIPDDTLRLQEESTLFYNKYRPNILSTFWLTYYPKTAIVEIARRKGLLNDDDIDNIEEGIRLTNASYLSGGSMLNPKIFSGISLLLNYLPILPKILISLLVYTRLYRAFRIKNYFITTAIPRAVVSIFNRKDFRGRSHIIRFFDKLLQKLRGSK
jgi:radical SAM superfamily enzyme YgiQ (UPF0313 family)